MSHSYDRIVAAMARAEVTTRDPLKRRVLSEERCALMARMQRASRPYTGPALLEDEPLPIRPDVGAAINEAVRVCEMWGVDLEDAS